MFSDYIRGLLYGDGHLSYKEGTPILYFSSTHLILAGFVEDALQKHSIPYIAYERETGDWSPLAIIESRDKEVIRYVDETSLFQGADLNPDFLRGYLETKGTFFSYDEQGKTRHRIAYSGSCDDMERIHQHLSDDLGVSCSSIIHRKEREEQGIISVSYRFAIQNRDGIYKMVDYLYDKEEISPMLLDTMDEFLAFNENTPSFRMKDVFKNYRNATKFMTRHLGLDIQGKKGGGAAKPKPVFLWENGEVVREFTGGWKEAYVYTSELFAKTYPFDPPRVERGTLMIHLESIHLHHKRFNKVHMSFMGRREGFLVTGITEIVFSGAHIQMHKLCWCRFHSAKGEQLEAHGIKPDSSVPLSEEELDQLKRDIEQEVTKNPKFQPKKK
ncbi:hypothetical protein IMZ31_19080 (plasmid) [Pontibacillus sp. ALD_SL1]|uniref:hypothetical protein n=1 Tax=Pontibacillus sp. ALD_SL1 TaxID=2777185 RepID=UPI001A9598CB|nr:hypothetical protein [Pontibacillus sp. ALD_SL1]QST02654.1 hypothetical protein IMZ31_19080 [Pontibacillus sp. ALD_SL1]